MTWLQVVVILLLIVQACVQYSLAQTELLFPSYIKYVLGVVGIAVTVAVNYLPPVSRPTGTSDRATARAKHQPETPR